MAQKATHSGSCQVCGRTQLLPGGKLSLHGYTKQWGFFNGTCPGSKHLPFEQDKSLIEIAIVETVRDKATQVALAAALREPTAATKAWNSFYIAATWQVRHSSYAWHQVELTRTEETRPDGWVSVTFTYPHPFKKTAAGDPVIETLRHGAVLHRATLADAVLTLNSIKAKEVHDLRAKQLGGYISWQRARIANWTPQPLTPRKSAAA